MNHKFILLWTSINYCNEVSQITYFAGCVWYNLVFLLNAGPGSFLFNVREICAMLARHLKATGYYQKINQSKIKITEKGCYSENNTLTFSEEFLMESPGHYTGLLAVQCCSNSIKTTLSNAFSCAMLSQEYWNNIEKLLFLRNVVWSLLDNIVQGFYLCDVIPRVLKEHWTILFPVQFCLEPLGQHCTRIFICVMLSHKYWDNIEQFFLLCNVV